MSTKLKIAIFGCIAMAVIFIGTRTNYTDATTNIEREHVIFSPDVPITNVFVNRTNSMFITDDNILWGMGWFLPIVDFPAFYYIDRIYYYVHAPLFIMDNVADVSVGGSFATRHVHILQTDGNLLAWGNNAIGQLGDGTNRSRTDTVSVKSGVAAISSGLTHTLAIRYDLNFRTSEIAIWP